MNALSRPSSVLPPVPSPLARQEIGKEGPPLVFLHGTFGAGEDLVDVAEELLPRRSVLLDLPGHGRSSRWPGPWTRQGVLHALEAEVPAGAVLIGYSLGGRLALELALRRSLELTALVVESGHPGLEDAEEAERRAFLDEERAASLRREPEVFLERWLEQPLFASLRDHPARAALVKERAAHLRLEGPEGWARCLGTLSVGRQPNLWPWLSLLKVPTLFLSGELDEKYTEVGSRMAAASSRVHHVVIEGVGHNVHLESSGAFRRALSAFFDKVCP